RSRSDVRNSRSLDTGKEHIPCPVVLTAIAARAGESLFQSPQATNVCETEVSPTELSTRALAQLEGQKALDAVLDAVVMRLRDSDRTRLVGELDETLLANGAHQICVHDSTMQGQSAEFRIRLRRD